MQMLSDKQIREQARKRVDFKRHLLVYFVINTVLWAIWYATGQGYPWPVWPMAGWGVGLIFHYLFDFRSFNFLSEEEEFRKLKQDMSDTQKIAQ